MYKGSHNPPRSLSTHIMWAGLLISLIWFAAVPLGFSDIRILIAGGGALIIGIWGAIAEAIVRK